MNSFPNYAPHNALRRGQRARTALLSLALMALMGSAPPLQAQVLVGRPLPLRAQLDVLTYHNDLARTGQNLAETILTPSNVNVAHFGRLFSHALDGPIYAQPLIFFGLSVNGATHNVVFVATQNDSVYAFDADDSVGDDANPLWQVSLMPSGASSATLGICGTPVIDSTTQTLYLVAATLESEQVVQRLHALNLSTGGEKFSGPVAIQATIPGVGDGSSNGQLPFIVSNQLQRPGLVLNGGVVYITFGTAVERGDELPSPPYHGWVFGYDAATLQQKYVFCSGPNAQTDPSGYPLGACGIWQSGGGPASDGTSLYVETGNGSFTIRQSNGQFDPANSDFGDSFVKVGIVNGKLLATDYFTPYNQDALNHQDLDLGSSGPMLLPDSVGSAAHPHLLVGADKEGRIFLVDRDNMGQYTAGADPSVDKLVQSLPGGTIGGVWGMPAYYNGIVYYGGVSDAIKGFSIANGALSTQPVTQTLSVFAYPGMTPSVSGNSANLGATGIVWAIENQNGLAILHAYAAADLTNELYNSAQAPGRDDAGYYVKFTTPTIANGKVYVAGYGTISVYGLGNFAPMPTITPARGNFYPSVQVSLTDSLSGAQIYYTLDGSTPTTASPLYTGPFSVSQSSTVNARAFAPGDMPSGIASAAFLIFPIANVSGVLTLEGIVSGAAMQTITFTLRPTDSSGNLTMTAMVGPDGSYTLANVPRKTYVMHIKGLKYLATNITVDVTAGNVSNANALLLVGDADNDNAVDIGDFGILVNAYNSDVTIPNSGYDPAADFNCDGVVDISDFGLLINNYNTMGAP